MQVLSPGNRPGAPERAEHASESGQVAAVRAGRLGRPGAAAFFGFFSAFLEAACSSNLTIPHPSAFRPSMGLTGRTPDEVYFDHEPAVEKPRGEPRAKWPRSSGCTAPYVPVRGECGAKLELEVRYLEGRKHLPVFRLREAA